MKLLRKFAAKAGNKQTAKKQFIKWFKRREPFLFNVAKHRFNLRNPGLNGNMEMAGISEIFTGIVDTVKNVAPSLIQLSSQKKILDMQIKRAEQGLPPLDAAQYSPTIKVEAAISPESEEAAKRIAIETSKQGISELKPIFFGALLLGALMLLRKKR